MTALVFVHPDRETLVVSGPDRVSWLNGLLTCDINEVSSRHGVFGLALSRTGKIHTDVWVLAAPDRLFLAVAAGTSISVHNELNKMLIMEDAELSLETATHSWLSVHGEQSESVESSATALASQLEAGALGQIHLTAATDWVLVAARERVNGWLGSSDRSLPAGAVLGGGAQYQALCIERGLPQFGVDYDGKDNPHDASLERRAVSWTKGCYLGQEVVCMQDMRGKPKRRIVPLVLSEPPSAQATVVDGQGTPVGVITSAGISPKLGPVALARLNAADAEGDKAGLFVDGKAAQRIVP